MPTADEYETLINAVRDAGKAVDDVSGDTAVTATGGRRYFVRKHARGDRFIQAVESDRGALRYFRGTPPAEGTIHTAVEGGELYVYARVKL